MRAFVGSALWGSSVTFSVVPPQVGHAGSSCVTFSIVSPSGWARWPSNFELHTPPHLLNQKKKCPKNPGTLPPTFNSLPIYPS